MKQKILKPTDHQTKKPTNQGRQITNPFSGKAYEHGEQNVSSLKGRFFDFAFDVGVGSPYTGIHETDRFKGEDYRIAVDFRDAALFLRFKTFRPWPGSRVTHQRNPRVGWVKSGLPRKGSSHTFEGMRNETDS
jgi:hypothetical protein